jgi:hypothetical protein
VAATLEPPLRAPDAASAPAAGGAPAEGFTTESQSFETEPQPANRATHKSAAGVLMKFKLDLLSRMSVGLRVEPNPAIDA